MTPLPSTRVVLFCAVTALVWWPLAQASPIAGAYLAGVALVASGLLAVHDLRAIRPATRPATQHADDFVRTCVDEHRDEITRGTL